MKRVSRGYSRVDIPLFPTMINAPKTSPSRITSSPSLSPQTHPYTSQPQTTPVAEETTPLPHESPLQSFHLLGRDEGSLSLHELMALCTKLSKKGECMDIRTSDDTEVLLEEEEPTKLLEDQGSGEKGEKETFVVLLRHLVPSEGVQKQRKDKGKIYYARNLRLEENQEERDDTDKSHAVQLGPFSVAEVRKNMCTL
ncbi:hypothetical protein Tco_0503137 [Tanacetum coccineum]